MTGTKISRLLALAAAGAMTAMPLLAQAQAAEDGADNPLGLPNNISLLAPADPNVRKATAVVNGDIITGTDVDQRLALLLAANKQQVPAEEMTRLRMQVLRNLIDETLQIQAAKAQEMTVEPSAIEQSYSRVAAQNFGQRSDAMDTYLKSIGSSSASLKRQIEGELAWQRLQSRNIAPFVNVSAEEVNDVIKRLEASKGTDEYRLGEIFLAATPESDTAVKANADKIAEMLKQGGSFAAYARQFSEASTAAVGGDLGWIQLAQLKNPQLEQVASELTPGQLVGPIAIPGGYSILYLIDKRQILMADPRDAVLSLKQIQMTFAPGTTEDQARAKLGGFVEGVKAMRGCGDAESAAAALGASVVTNDQIRVRALPEQLQQIVLGLQVGQSTPPFGNIEEGVRVLMLCGRDDPKVEGGPDFDSIMRQIEDERIDKRAQRYLRDLRNDAYIEYN